VIEKLKVQLRRHEGLRLEPYQCSENHWTVGFGHNLDSHGEHLVPNITLEKAEYLLDLDIQQSIIDCGAKIQGFSKLDPVRQAVLINMCFNLGINGLLKFKNMLAAISEQDWPMASLAMMNSLWAKQVKGRAVELAQMMETGTWPDEK
jgi:lysozyme